MPLNRLHLVVDDDLGPALWVREQTSPGRSRALEQLTPLRADAPAALAAVLDDAPERLRHRVRIPGRGGAPDRRVPALPLDGPALIGLVDAVTGCLHDRFGDEALEQVTRLLTDGTAVRLAADGPAASIAAMPDVLAATVLDVEARELVRTRDLRVTAEERHGQALLRWLAPTEGRPALLHALVDAHARQSFATHLAGSSTRGPGTGAEQGAEDRYGVLDALASDAGLRADVPEQRAIVEAFTAYIASGRVGVHLTSTDSDLVVRLHEPPVGTAWPLQTCLRQEDGTIHSVADLRAVGDLSAAGAAEATAEVMRLAPTVRQAAMDDTGVDWLLTTAEAGAFLAHDTPGLEQAGVTVLLPRDWTKQAASLRPQVTEEPATERESSVGLGQMTQFRWRMAVGDTELTDEEMAEILAAQAELVQLRGQWVRLDATTLRAAERFLGEFTDRARRFRRLAAERAAQLGRAGDEAAGAASAPPAPEDVPTPVLNSLYPVPDTVPGSLSGILSWAELFSLVLSPQAAELHLGSAALADVDKAGIGRLLPGGPGPRSLPQPSSLRATLRPYQRAGLDWMWELHQLGLGGILADDMGLGKTMQVLALLCREREARPVGPTLLVCPMSVVGAWQREARAFAPHLAVHVHHGGDRIRDESFIAGAADMDLVITTYALLARDLSVLQRVDWHRVVYDEAQHLKNPHTQVSRAARKLRPPHRLALTGTPVENRLEDLHSLMEVVEPGLLGTATEFSEHVAGPISKDADPAALARLKLVTSPFVLRRVKTDRAIIADLPEKRELTRTVTLTPEQAGLYEALVQELKIELDQATQKQRRSVVVSTITRLKQVCNHPAHYLGDGSAMLKEGRHRSGKLELVDDLLETAFADGEKVLLFTQFTTFGHLLVPYWAQKFGLPVPFLHGGVAKKDRDQMVAQFQAERDQPGLMLLSLRAGGTGLTLTAANHVVHLDRWWNPAVENQATDRAFRIGQRKDVQVHKLVSAGTIEERIDTVLLDKQSLADLTIAPGEDWLAQLDDDSLLELLSLSAEDKGGGPE